MKGKGKKCASFFYRAVVPFVCIARSTVSTPYVSYYNIRSLKAQEIAGGKSRYYPIST